MLRREVLLGGGALVVVALSARPRAAIAQQLGPSYRLAVVHPSATEAELGVATDHPIAALYAELTRLGYVEGRNLTIERWSFEGQTAQFRQRAREVVSRSPDVIVTVSSAMVRAFKAATSTIPVVFSGADPVALGLVDSLARPGGNLTGLSIDAGFDLYGKRLEMLREIIPAAARVAFLIPRHNWSGPPGDAVRTAAARLGMTVVPATLGDPIQESEYRRVFAALEPGLDAVYASAAAEHVAHGRLIGELALKARIPAITAYPDPGENGILFSYANDAADQYRRVAGYVARILAGAAPSDLPISQVTTLKLVINLRTASALGLTVPSSLLLRADKVIE